MGTLRLLLLEENNLRHGVIPALFGFLLGKDRLFGKRGGETHVEDF